MKVLDEFNITDRINIKLQVGDYRGSERVDIREYIKVNDKETPTKKGVNFSSEWLDRFILMIEKLKAI